MPGIRIEGLLELRDAVHAITVRYNDREFADAVHTALIRELREGFVPTSGKIYPLYNPATGKEYGKGPRNIEKGSLKRALLNRGDRNHVWRWLKGRFHFGAKGGPPFGETADTGYNRAPRTGKSKGPKGNVARALRFQSKRLIFSDNLSTVWDVYEKKLFALRPEGRGDRPFSGGES